MTSFIQEYSPEDTFFGQAWIDQDEERSVPRPHRYIHGGFDGTDTRFSFYFLPKAEYRGRFVQVLEGGTGGSEHILSGTDSFYTRLGFDPIFGLGAYMVESNQGHIGVTFDLKAQGDASIYGYRASAEAARFSRFMAGKIYGSEPRYGYVYGGSGGGKRSINCIESDSGVWDGAVPFVIGTGKYPVFEMYAATANARRLLGDKISDVVNALEPGGSGDPFARLDTYQREALAELYALGFPRGAEGTIALPGGERFLWAWEADRIDAIDPDYYANFWTKPGYAGFDQRSVVEQDLIDVKTHVKQVLTAGDLAHSGTLGPMIALMARGRMDFPIAIEVEAETPSKAVGMGVLIASGEALGRQLYATFVEGDIIIAAASGESGQARFLGVKAGDEIHLNNRRYLAWCYFHRHHVNHDLPVEFGKFMIDGNAIYPQHEPYPMMDVMGNPVTGKIAGKAIVVQNLLDTSVWPGNAVQYSQIVQASLGTDAQDRLRLWFNENAEHSTPLTHSLIDYFGIVHEALFQLTEWVERNVPPAPNTAFSYDGRVTLQDQASERGGVQPIITASVNGSDSIQLAVGDAASFEIIASVPPGGGSIIRVEWDYDGSGTFDTKVADIDGTASSVCVALNHAFAVPGTYLPIARVTAHRDGEVEATGRLLTNIARVKVVVVS